MMKIIIFYERTWIMKKNLQIMLSALFLMSSVNLMGRTGETILKNTLSLYIPSADFNPKDREESNVDQLVNLGKLAAQEAAQSLIWAYMMGSSYSKIGASNLAKTTLLHLGRRIIIESLTRTYIGNPAIEQQTTRSRASITFNAITSPMTTAYMLGHPLYHENQSMLTGLHLLKGLIF